MRTFILLILVLVGIFCMIVIHTSAPDMSAMSEITSPPTGTSKAIEESIDDALLAQSIGMFVLMVAPVAIYFLHHAMMDKMFGKRKHR